MTNPIKNTMKNSMKATINQSPEQITICLEGYLDFESTIPLKDRLDSILQTGGSKSIVFDFSRLNFVGSSGITTFIRTLKDFNTRALSRSSRTSYLNVQKEFRKLMAAFDQDGSFEFCEGNGATSSPSKMDH